MQGLNLLVALSWRNLWRNQRRTFITFTSISVGVWSMIVLASMMDAWAMSTFHSFINTLTGHGQIHAAAYLDDPNIEHSMNMPANKLRQQLNSQGVKSWTMRMRVPGIIQSERETAPVMLIGIEPGREETISFIEQAIVEGIPLKQIRENHIVLGQKLISRLDTKINKRVVLLSQNTSGNIAERGFTISSIYQAEQQDTEIRFAFILLSSAQSMLKAEQKISEISFLLNDVKQLDTFVEQIRKIDNTHQVSTWYELSPFTKASLDMSTATIAIWTITMFILLAFGLMNTLLMAVYERSREFGLLQALGMRPGLIIYQILIESLFLIGISVLIGSFSGILTIHFFNQGLSLGELAEGATLFGAGRTLYPQIDPLQIFYIAIFVWLMGIVTSLYPAWQAARKVPVDTINKNY